MNNDYFTQLSTKLRQYDGDSSIFDDGNNFIVNTLQTIYGLRSVPKTEQQQINRDFFIKNDNPFLPLYFALQTRRSKFTFRKLEHDFALIKKYKTHPLYFLTMGLAYLYNLGTPKDADLAYRHFLRGSKNDCVICTFYLAKFLMMGNVTPKVKRNVQKAITYFEDASKKGLAAATHELAFLHAIRESKQQEKPNTLHFLKLLAVQAKQTKDVVYRNFGMQMYKHFDVKDKMKNRPQKEYWIKLAYNYGAPNSALVLYFFYQQAKSSDPNAYAQAIEYLFEASKTRHPVALFELANEYLDGEYLPNNLDMALKYFKASAGAGYGRAYLFVAALYATDSKRFEPRKVHHYVDLEYKRIVEANEKKGQYDYPFKIRHYEIKSKYALRGYLYYEVANLLAQRKLNAQAELYYSEAIKYDFDGPTYAAQGDMYTREMKSISDRDRPKRAYNHYLGAIEESYFRAYDRLAKCFALGFGVQRDEEKAENYINKYIEHTEKNEIETLINFYTEISYAFNEGRLVARDTILANYYLDKALSLQKN
ncbi:MAG TPA: hypothetical protein VFD05_00635 [Bacilli bacterium]|nr:hypothetical protein [Bacilli bacterium]